MPMFEKLTVFLTKINIDKYGKWSEQPPDADGTSEHPYQFPFVIYETVIDEFVYEVYAFIDLHKDMELTKYSLILEEKGIKWSSREMKTVDVSSLDGRTVMALIVGAIRAERFCDGALLDFFESGSIRKWLERLNELDNG